MSTAGSPEWLADLAQKGASLGSCGKMCRDCAFKLNQPHTPDYLLGVYQAAICLAWDGEFNCHTPDHENAGHPCAGFLYARQYLQSGA